MTTSCSRKAREKPLLENHRMSRGPGIILRRVLLAVCIIQVVITAYLALCIFNSAFSTVKEMKSFPQLEPRKKSENQQEGQGKKLIDFDIGENQAAIVLAQQEMKPHVVQGMEVKWDEAPAKISSGLINLPVVEVWSKAAVGTYLWQHILEGEESLDETVPGATLGELRMPAFILRYRSGPGVTPDSVPRDMKNVVLVVNGRTEEKVTDAKYWLDSIQSWDTPPVVILVMLGNEQCENHWVDGYIQPNGAVVTVLVTYDDPRVDQVTFYQWPLGVATYRQFPVISEDQIVPDLPRKYVCNLRVTLHANSSRIELHKFMKNDPFSSSHCYINVRERWLPNETVESMDDYVRSLLQSDLSLCPAGMNTETYRVYEALSAGSTPIIEDVATKGQCDSQPWRLLKRHGPPVIWVKTWEQLPKILAKERRYSKQYKALRRLRVSQWYEWFKLKMRDRFISIVTSSLLQPD
ncbi:ribitol-5-phosphate xylosyltransferase 1-like isoform X2 [Homarus americanus]|uniref:ribitol-5-phosphate xylosyltransferase 1-like isoform X2 n=1 Tax=Homarus americanus TaxID=6706 RepID=UPI001C46EF7E|nr:ribitol-5-phosphate xylosyltransferase 1-like isoform X2 [Homarus americanus]